jgi:hypothetical protein
MPCLTHWHIWLCHMEVGRTLVLSPSTNKSTTYLDVTAVVQWDFSKAAAVGYCKAVMVLFCIVLGIVCHGKVRYVRTLWHKQAYLLVKVGRALAYERKKQLKVWEVCRIGDTLVHSAASVDMANGCHMCWARLYW